MLCYNCMAAQIYYYNAAFHMNIPVLPVSCDDSMGRIDFSLHHESDKVQKLLLYYHLFSDMIVIHII